METNKMKNLLDNLIRIIVIACFVLGTFFVWSLYNKSQNPPLQIPADNGQNSITTSATNMASGGNPIPTTEYIFLQRGDFAGLQKYLDDNKENWVSISMNIETGQVMGVTPPQGPIPNKAYGTPPQGAAVWQEVHNESCDWTFPNPLQNPLCMWYKVGFTSVYKGDIIAGVNDDFILKPVVTLKNDWSNSSDAPTIESNKITTYQESTAIVTYTGNICVTAVEQNTFTPIHTSDVQPTDKSYTLRVEEKRNVFGIDINWTDSTSGINEEYLRNMAEGTAKVIALSPENVRTIYEIVQDDMNPGGAFRQKIEAFFTPELAKQLHIKDFEIVFNVTMGDPQLRCDGTNVNK